MSERAPAFDQYYAHTKEGQPQEAWEKLADHLPHTADRAAAFAEAFGAGQWGHLAGLWHDLGKYAAEFQRYLRAANGEGAHLEGAHGRVDHSTAGAAHAVRSLGDQAGRLLAYVIAGHHAGLPDWDDFSSRACLKARLSNDRAGQGLPPGAPKEVAHPGSAPVVPFRFAPDNLRRAAFQVAFLCRMLYSCLVDADFLCTEAFLDPGRAETRAPPSCTIESLEEALTAHLGLLAAKATPLSTVNVRRKEVLDACLAAAELKPGLFSLTVPTGGGKTYSSLAFGLRHARLHELRRVISVIPYTSIIEQNADRYREALAPLGGDMVLEHHSNLDPEEETKWSRLASENWDAPVVVTTNVQFFESLFACRSSRCRKLHNIAHSVVILDEVQTLPVDLLHPCLEALRELVDHYGCSVVLCTATQPALNRSDEFPIGLENAQEIIPRPGKLYANMRRVSVKVVGSVSDEQLGQSLLEREQVLCVVNTRRHAARVFEAMGEDAGIFHLSTWMCPEHRSEVIAEIGQRLRDGLRCRVVSTQLIEAGVDLDFPVVYRAMAGIDSIAQAAGRCNREGRLPAGEVYVFEPDEPIPAGHLRQTAQTTRELLGLHEDLLGLDAVQAYFRLHYWDRRNVWDQHDVLAQFQSAGQVAFQFRKAAELFQFIDDRDRRPIIVPWGERGRDLARRLTNPAPPDWRAARQAQRLIVAVRDREWEALQAAGAVEVFHDQYPLLQDMKLYSPKLGLRIESAAEWNPESRIC